MIFLELRWKRQEVRRLPYIAALSAFSPQTCCSLVQLSLRCDFLKAVLHTRCSTGTTVKVRVAEEAPLRCDCSSIAPSIRFAQIAPFAKSQRPARPEDVTGPKQPLECLAANGAYEPNWALICNAANGCFCNLLEDRSVF